MRKTFWNSRGGSESDDDAPLGVVAGSDFGTERHGERQTMRQTLREPFVDGENDDSAQALRMAVTRTARRLRQEAGSDLSPTALAALASIERHSPVTPTRLAEIEGVKRPTVTRVINHLVDAGMIERHPDPDDGRSCRLELNQQGSEYLAEHRSRKSAYLARLLDSLPAEDVKTLERAAEILNHALLGSREQKGVPA